MGLPDLIADTLQDYERKALALAGDPARLKALREILVRHRATAAPFDLPRSTRSIEAAYARMWATWCAGEKPAGFSLVS